MTARLSIPRGLRSITESQWQETVLHLARLWGWRVAHFRPAQTAKGWRTPVAADGAGFPDLTLVRERLVFAELKTDKGRVSPAQAEWIDALRTAGIEAHVWRPRDLAEVKAALR